MSVSPKVSCFLFFLIHQGICYTHWMVTDDGLNIQSVADSPYHMAQPHSLVEFLDQERKLDLISESREYFAETEKSIKARESADDPNLEDKIRSTDKNCLLVGNEIANKDAFLQTHSLGIPEEDFAALRHFNFVEDEISVKEEPYCTYELPFSMYAFEHFKSMQLRKNFSFSTETDLRNMLPPEYILSEFGDRVAKALKEKPTDASFLRLAALYWKIEGKAPEAVECIRLALHFTPRKLYIQTAYELGNMLHRAGYSADALIIYQLTFNKYKDSAVEMALGDAYALLQNRTEAVKHYEKVGDDYPRANEAVIKAAGVRCDITLLAAMEEQHRNLLDAIAEKNAYNSKREFVKNMEEAVKKNVADVETLVQSSLIFDHFTYGSLPYSSCRTITVLNRLAMQCTVSDWRRYQIARDEKHRKMVANAKKNPQKVKNKIVSTYDEKEFETEELAKFLENLEPMKGMDIDEPTTQPLYPLIPTQETQKLVDLYLSSAWPNETQCKANKYRYSLPTQNRLPQLFIGAESKGYSTSDLLGKYMNLSPTQEHPLPWHLPYCGTFIENQNLSALLELPGLKGALSTKPSVAYAEDKLRPAFMGLLNASVAEADIAQRIQTLMEYDIGPRWLVFNMAALYWRILGTPSEAVRCLQAALHHQPDRHADVALVQLAQVVMRCGGSGRLDDAIALLNTAVHIDASEPITHFLIGVVRILQRSHTSALSHVRAAVLLDPTFQPAVNVLHSLKCANKMTKGLLTDRVYLSCCSESEPSVYCFGDHHNGCFKLVNKYTAVAVDCGAINQSAEGICRRGLPFAPLIIPTNIVYSDENINEPRKKLHRQSGSTAESQQRIDDNSDVIPLDYDGEVTYRKIRKMKLPTFKNLRQIEIIFTNDDGKAKKNEEMWEEEVPVDKVVFPEWQLTTSRVPERRRMIAFDIPLPEVLPLPSNLQIKSGLSYLPLPSSRTSNVNFCTNTKMSLTMLREQTTSTWLSAAAKGVNVERFINFGPPLNLDNNFEPVCEDLKTPAVLRTLDHLPAYHLRDQFIYYKPEKALTDAFLSLGNGKERIEIVAGKLKEAMKASAGSSFSEDFDNLWALSTTSALYWRVKGDAVNALKCLRYSLHAAPNDMRDVALVSMANIYQQAGLLHSALIAGGAALAISPKLVAIHFTLANIYASLEKYEHALKFYFSTLSLQSNFEPAKERIRTIYCYTEKSYQFSKKLKPSSMFRQSSTIQLYLTS